MSNFLSLRFVCQLTIPVIFQLVAEIFSLLFFILVANFHDLNSNVRERNVKYAIKFWKFHPSLARAHVVASPDDFGRFNVLVSLAIFSRFLASLTAWHGRWVTSHVSESSFSVGMRLFSLSISVIIIHNFWPDLSKFDGIPFCLTHPYDIIGPLIHAHTSHS